jgi:hypothetical protein
MTNILVPTAIDAVDAVQFVRPAGTTGHGHPLSKLKRMAIATSAATFVDALGINTHIDFAAYGYQNLAAVESDINYLGVKIIRDSADVATDAQSWQQVAQATGAKFDDYIAETSPAGMQTDLGFVRQLAQEGILASVEGGNEEDDAYPQSLGNTLLFTAQFQQQVYA